MKKRWEKPSVLIIARNRPEETVLAGCKLLEGGTGPTGQNSVCNEKPFGTCGVCFLGGSGS